MSDELIELRLKLLGARKVVDEALGVSGAIGGVGKASKKTGMLSQWASGRTSALSSAYRKLKTAAKYAFLAIAAGGVMMAKNAITNTMELSKATAGLSRNFGFSTNVASRWAAVMFSREADPKALSQALGTLSTKFVTAGREGGKAMTAFHLLGISQQEAAHGAKNYQWGIMRVAKALGEEAGGSKRAAAAKALLGKGFQLLTPLFSEGAKGLKEQLHWADKYGVTLTTKTNDSLFEFVQAQRESKVAVLGLEIGLTKFLLPALKGAEGGFQQFVRVLNSDLTTEQKMNHIAAMFEKLEDVIIKFIGDALPKVAEAGGTLGLKLAGAVVTGFLKAGIWGKLLIGYWVYKAMGGPGLIKAVMGRIGKMMAMGLMKIFVPEMAAEMAAGSTLGQMLKARFSTLGKWSGRAFDVGLVLGASLLGYWLGTELMNRLSKKTKRGIVKWGINAGLWFVNALLKQAEIGYGLIRAGWNNTVGSLLGVPDLPAWNTQFHPFDQGSPTGSGTHGLPPSGPLGVGKKRRNYEEIWGKPPPAGPPPWPHPHASAKPRHKLSSLEGRPQHIQHIHLHMDGREIAFGVLRHGENAAALA